MASVIHQHESAIGIHVPPPSHLPRPHPARYSQSTCFGFPVSHIKLPLAIYFTHGNIYVSKLFSQIITPFSFPTVSRSLFLLSVSPLLPCMYQFLCWYYLSRFHRYVLVENVFFRAHTQGDTLKKFWLCKCVETIQCF